MSSLWYRFSMVSLELLEGASADEDEDAAAGARPLPLGDGGVTDDAGVFLRDISDTAETGSGPRLAGLWPWLPFCSSSCFLAESKAR